jgi:hypothetical protein
MPVFFDWFNFISESFFDHFYSEEQTIELEDIDLLKSYRESVCLAMKLLLDDKEADCDICYETYIGADKFSITLSCNHFFCKECLRDYL